MNFWICKFRLVLRGKNLAIFLIIFFVEGFFSKKAVGQETNWTTYSERIVNYPTGVFFTGFMSQYIEKSDDLAIAKSKIMEQAKVQLSENIRISIQSSIVNKMSNINSESVEEFEKVSTSFSQISISGLKIDFSVNRKKKEILAFAWISKQEVQNHYKNLIQLTYIRAEGQLQTAQKWFDSNQAMSLKTLYDIYPLIRNMEESQTILIISGIQDNDVLLRGKIQKLKWQVSEFIRSIEQNKGLSISQLVSIISNSLKAQISSQIGAIKVENITYKGSKIGSMFSERYTQLLRSSLTHDGLLVVEREGELSSEVGEFLLSGTYWEDGDDIQIIQNLYGVNKKRSSKIILASSEGWVSKKTLGDSELDYLPSNYVKAEEQNNVFWKEGMINGGAQLDVRTDKGTTGIIYQEGEKISLSIKLNKPGYVRLINHWADGTMGLLLDNYYVDYSKVNKTIPLPLELEIVCPCGAEFIQVNAQSIEFVPLDLIERDGFSFIKEPFEIVVNKNRSQIKKVLGSDGFTVESRLTITTIGDEN